MSEINRPSRRFNLIDFLIIVLLFSAVLSLILRGNLGRELGLQEVGQKAEYKLLLTEVEKEDIGLFLESTELIYPATGEKLGTILKTQKENERVFTSDETGALKTVFDPAKYEIILTISGTAKHTEKGFLVNAAIFASPGDTITIYCAGKTFSATVLEIRNI